MPHLRLMAQRESIADKIYAECQMEEDDDDFQKKKRRRTRRSIPQGRTHYFDIVLGTSHHSKEKIGKSIGEELATMKLQYKTDDR
jgi:hypothetical protein